MLLDWHNVHDTLSEKNEIISLNSIDIIFGSALIYNLNKDHISSFAGVVDRYLRDDGVFYLIQSTDREVCRGLRST